MPVRIIPMGDAAEAGKYVGLAKRLLARAAQLGKMSDVLRVDAQTTIHVQTQPTEKIWIYAGGDGEWYQFIHTTARPVLSFLGGLPFLWGSGVQLRLPRVRAGQAVVWSKPPIPTGSAVEGNEHSPWPLRMGRKTADQARLTAFQGSNQVQLLPLPVFAGWVDADAPVSWVRLMHSQAGEPGQVTGAGVASPLPGLGFRDADVIYDAAPARVAGRRAYQQAPDADWYHEAAAYRITHPAHGARDFVVMAAADGVLHCWPLAARGEQAASEYADQEIKTNVAPEFAKAVVPPYPDWVFRPDQPFRDQWRTDRPQSSPDPRYAWAFHPFTPRAACIAIQRQEAPGTLHQSFETSEHTYTEAPHATPFRVRLGDRLAAEKDFPSSNKKTLPVSDRPGLLEFDLTIQITGPELGDFNFSVTLRDQFLAAGADYPVAVGYLAPVADGWASRGIAASAGDRIEVWLIAETDPANEAVSAAWGGRWLTPMRRVSVGFRVAGNEVLRVRLVDDRLMDRVGSAWSWHGHEALDGFISDLNLAQLTFVVTWQHSRYQRGPVVDQRFATVSGQWASIVDWPMADGHLVTREIETGIRVYHRGHIAIERRYGPELGVFAAVDAPFDDPSLIPLSVDERGTLWQYAPGRAAVHELLNRTGTCLYAAVALRAIMSIVGTNYPAVNAAMAQESGLDILAQTFAYGDELTPPFTQASLAALWSGYSPEWFETAITPLVDRCWRWARRFLAEIPDPDHHGMRRFGRVVASAALVSQFPPWFFMLSGWHDPAPMSLYPHVNNWPNGEQLFSVIWRRTFPHFITIRAIADHRGFLAVWLPVLYTAQPIPYAVEYSILNDAFPAIVNPDLAPDSVPEDTGLQAIVWLDTLSRRVPTPSCDVMAQAVIDVIRHENGGETSHLAAYNAAYGHALTDTEMFLTPGVEVDPDTETFVYTASWPAQFGSNTQTLKIDMPGAPDMRSFFNYYAPRANGAALFH